MHRLTLDHIPFAWDDLDEIRTAIEVAGVPTEYGGVHSDGTTHMAVVGFPDGSYLELLAPTEDTHPSEAGFWPDAIETRAGPAAWCVAVDDASAAAKAAIDAGLPVDGPHYAARERPDGALVEWDMAFQDGDAGPLPFVVSDRTPREYRVTPTAELPSIWGISEVVIAVEDVEAVAREFDRRYRFPAFAPLETDVFADDVSTAPGQPVSIVEATSWSLTDRLADVGPGPCAFLLGTEDLDELAVDVLLTDTHRWGETRLAWLDADPFRGRLGVVERPSPLSS